MQLMKKMRLSDGGLRWAAIVGMLVSGCLQAAPLLAQAEKDPLGSLSNDFWQWRARYQPFSQDDIPRIERPIGPRDWSANSIARQKETLEAFEKRWKQIDPKSWSVAQRVDYRLLGSALARVRWELEINPRWQRDPTFYVDQTMTALLEALVQPPPFTASRSREIVERMEQIPRILDDGKANLHPVRPFAALAIADLEKIRPKLERVQRNVAPMLPDVPASDNSGGMREKEKFEAATAKAIFALESYKTGFKP